MPILFEVVHDHSEGEIPGPIPNPEVKPSCVVLGTVVREPTETVVVVPLQPLPVSFGWPGAHPHTPTNRADRLLDNAQDDQP